MYFLTSPLPENRVCVPLGTLGLRPLKQIWSSNQHTHEGLHQPVKCIKKIETFKCYSYVPQSLACDTDKSESCPLARKKICEREDHKPCESRC